ncbi:hypothetical protein SAMN05444714_3316 [Yoonia litorea]|uniref:Uncharacterized protein n=1 Tax=Yoonia litorea TaxID=1123755 RepID=A0A1I6N3I7_9RHOB|nr:hypothetical protein SAMN05444714_3316 [Yoonia litorea]
MSASPRGPQGRGSAALTTGRPTCPMGPLPQHRPRVWPNTHVFGRNRGRAQTPPTGRTGRVKEGQIWPAKSLPQKPGGPGLPVFVDGPLEADWPVCRGLIIPGGVRPLTAQRPAPRGGRCRRSPAPVTAYLEQGSGRPKIVPGRPVLVRGFSPGDLSRSVGTSPAPRPRPGSRA